MTPKIPKYQLHKGTGQAKVRLNGRDFYLGSYGTPESRRLYDELVEKWLQNGRTIPGGGGSSAPDSVSGFNEITVVELSARYFRHCKEYYSDGGGRLTGSVDNAKQMIKRLKEIAGTLPVSQFGPKGLKAFQALCIKERLSRRYVNKLSDTLRLMFGWGVAEEIVPVATWQALKAAPNIRKGKTSARETSPVMPIDDAAVDATLPCLPPVPRDMVRLQRLTGARPGEICVLRPCDVDRSAEVWFYVPQRHKTEHLDKSRVIAIGPRGQAVLLPYLDRDQAAYCFSPTESETLRRLDLRRNRKTSVQPSQAGKVRRTKRPKTKPGERYTTLTYSNAVRRAAIAAGVEVWTPNRLRHSAATQIEGQFTLDDAQAVLGHSSPKMTRRYSDAQRRVAAQVMKEIG